MLPFASFEIEKWHRREVAGRVTRGGGIIGKIIIIGHCLCYLQSIYVRVGNTEIVRHYFLCGSFFFFSFSFSSLRALEFTQFNCKL